MAVEGDPFRVLALDIPPRALHPITLAPLHRLWSLS